MPFTNSTTSSSQWVVRKWGGLDLSGPFKKNNGGEKLSLIVKSYYKTTL